MVVAFISNLANAVPVVGHIKGGIHYICGDDEKGDDAMKASSRTTAVFGGGVGGFFVGGPVGAVAGGVAAGAVVDGATTGIESAIKGEYKPAGTIKCVTDAINAETGGTRALAVTGAVLLPVLDGVSGGGAGVITKSVVTTLAVESVASA